MANFEIAYNRTNINEGGWNHIQGDRGGETYCGIARKFHPNWAGWKIIDQYKKNNGGLRHGQIINDPQLIKLKKEFYKTEFWDIVGGDEIEDQRAANTLYDFGVNSGNPRSIKNLQVVLKLPQTGKISNELIDAANNPLNYILK